MLLQNDEKNFQNDGVVLIYHEKIDFFVFFTKSLPNDPWNASETGTSFNVGGIWMARHTLFSKVAH